MPNHGNVHHASGGGSQFQLVDPQAFADIQCGYCGRHVSAAVIAYSNESPAACRWVRCTSCQLPLVIVGKDTVFPAAPPGDNLEGLPPEVDAAYNEARRCFAVAAYTGCELVSRTLLMHVAVDKCGAPEGAQFVKYIDALEASGYITPPMKAWVDRIRTHANETTHTLNAPSRERADITLSFAMQLLRIVYEMEYQAKKADALKLDSIAGSEPLPDAGT